MASSVHVKASVNTIHQHCMCFVPKHCGNCECVYTWRLAALQISCFTQHVKAEIIVVSKQEYTSVEDATSAAYNNGICASSLLQIVLRHKCSQFNGNNHIINECKRNYELCGQISDDTESDEGIEDGDTEEEGNSNDSYEEEEANPKNTKNSAEDERDERENKKNSAEVEPDDRENRDIPDAKKRKML